MLAPVPTPASTTAEPLARRLDGDRMAGIEPGLAEVTARWMELVPAERRTAYRAGGADSGVAAGKLARSQRQPRRDHADRPPPSVA